MVIRTGLDNIRVMGRAAQGVRIVKLQEGDKVTDLTKVLEDDSPIGSGEEVKEETLLETPSQEEFEEVEEELEEEMEEEAGEEEGKEE
jgi:DNA gyrase subunit A